MSTQESLTRHKLIIQKLRANPSEFADIMEKLNSESELHDMNFEISKRTFQRDIKEIYYLYGIEIKYDRSQKVYYILNDSKDQYSQMLFEVIDIYQLLNLNQSISDFIQFSTRKPTGTEHLSGLLYAVQNRFQIKIKYKKFDQKEFEYREIEPYLLKEFRNRWYVYGFDLEKLDFRTYAIDRIQNFQILDKKFQFPKKINPKDAFKDSFGIVLPENMAVQKIILEFTNHQGDYIKTLPLHTSQKILKETEDRMLVSLKIAPTYDFIFELLSMGANVKVIEPESLTAELKSRLRQATELYS